MKDNFSITIETLHALGDGDMENVSSKIHHEQLSMLISKHSRRMSFLLIS